MRKYIKRTHDLTKFKAGRIKFYKEDKNYGFIVTDDGSDVFFHRSQLSVARYVPGLYDYSFSPSAEGPKPGHKVLYLEHSVDGNIEARTICDTVQLLMVDKQLNQEFNRLVEYRVVLTTWEIKYRADNQRKMWMPEQDNVDVKVIFEGNDSKYMEEYLATYDVSGHHKVEFFTKVGEVWTPVEVPCLSN